MAQTSLELGPCEVLWGVAGSEATIGRTEGGVTFTIIDNVQELFSDQYGEAPEDIVQSGQHPRVTVPFADPTFTNLDTALRQPAANVIISSTTNLIKGGNIVGKRLADDVANSLLLKKWIAGAASTSPNDFFRLPVAVPVGDVELGFSKDAQRIFTLTFIGFPDSSGFSYYIGDEASA